MTNKNVFTAADFDEILTTLNLFLEVNKDMYIMIVEFKSLNIEYVKSLLDL